MYKKLNSWDGARTNRCKRAPIPRHRDPMDVVGAEGAT